MKELFNNLYDAQTEISNQFGECHISSPIYFEEDGEFCLYNDYLDVATIKPEFIEGQTDFLDNFQFVIELIDPFDNEYTYRMNSCTVTVSNDLKYLLIAGKESNDFDESYVVPLANLRAKQ